MLNQETMLQTSTAIGYFSSHKPMFKVLATSSKTESTKESPTNTNALTKTIKCITDGWKAISSLRSSLSALSPQQDSVAPFLATLNNKIISPPLPPSVNPKLVLAGNFAPVDEMPPSKCLEVEGKIPDALQGTYIRNGPNPQHKPRGPYHIFDGDGMLHSIQLSDGHAIYCSRYVHTNKYKLESSTGIPMIPNFVAGFYGLADLGCLLRTVGKVMIGQVNILHGFGPANTSVTSLCDKLFAMNEVDLPYAIRLTQEGDIETVGRRDLAGKAPASMTAHPKVDPDTGEVFAFRWSLAFPYLNLFSLDSKGLKQQDVPIFSMDHYVHDFAITKHFAVFPESQLRIVSMDMILCKGMPLRYQPSRIPRIGVIPRYPASEEEMRWFPMPGFNAFHIVNAWEDDNNGLVIIAPNVASVADFLGSMDKVHFSLEKLRIDLLNGEVSRTVLSEKILELGTINPSYQGKKNRYVYMAIAEHVPKMSGVVKIDLELGCEVAHRSYGPGCFGGEAFFVARDQNDRACDEDDGFIVSFVHNEETNMSKFLIMDAKSPTLEVLAAVRLPGRVPYGFHGLFAGEEHKSISSL